MHSGSFCALCLAPLLQHGVFQQLQVHVVAHGHHVARTAPAPSRLPAPRISRSRMAILKPEPNSANSRMALEPLLRHLRRVPCPAEGQIGIGVAAGAPHAAADLVQLGQAEAVGVLDDEGVDVRDVDAGLDDGGADEDLDLAVRPCDCMTSAELLLVHLAVGRRPPPPSGMRCLICRGALVDRSRPGCAGNRPARRASSSRRMASSRMPSCMLQDEGLHRIAVLRRLLDGGHVPDAGQGHIERARDGRCG